MVDLNIGQNAQYTHIEEKCKVAYKRFWENNHATIEDVIEESKLEEIKNLDIELIKDCIMVMNMNKIYTYIYDEVKSGRLVC